MIPITVIIALIYTGILLIKEYFKFITTFDLAFYMLLAILWSSVYFDGKVFYITSVVLLALCVIIGFIPKEKQDIKVVNETLQEYNNLFKDVEGTVVRITGPTSYIGNIINNGVLSQILVQCEEKMEIGDKFVILGIDGSKIMANKKN